MCCRIECRSQAAYQRMISAIPACGGAHHDHAFPPGTVDGFGALLRCSQTLARVSALTDPAIERVQLATVLRQLDALERHADSSAALSHSIAARYHFDYLRLREDIQRIRSGVQSYLTPQRAQPRDPAPVLGEYIGEGDAP